ncbi:hypothetical protein OG828_12125 [Streptomyces sp. NBC_00457]
MDPISVGLLAALAGGAGGEVGRQAWAGLIALVHRPFQRGQGTAAASAVSSGEAELARLDHAPADPACAHALSTALAARAAVDADFQASLQRWQEQARLVNTGDGGVHNQILGGVFHGGAVQGRDFSGVSIAAPPPTPPASPSAGD